jgi:hypothetical protein
VRVTAALPASLRSPRLLASYDDGTWVGLLLEEVDGRPPALPRRPDELAAALEALGRLTDVPAPPGLPSAMDVLSEQFTGWRQLASECRPAGLAATPGRPRCASGAVAARGCRRPAAPPRRVATMITSDGTAVLVDWPWAAAGNPLLDVVGLSRSRSPG